MIGKILLVFALSTFELYAAIAAGFAASLSKWVILPIVLVGGTISVFVSAFLGRKIEHFIATKIKKQDPNAPKKPKNGFVFKLWDKYGLVGVGIIGTFFFGPLIAIGVATGFNANLKKLIPLCLTAVVLRCITFTLFGDLVKRWIEYF
jgi:hypothetical protein